MTHTEPAETPDLECNSAAGMAARTPQAAHGGTAAEGTPRLVIRGERCQQSDNKPASGRVALTDWLNFTFPFRDHTEAVGEFFNCFSAATGRVFGGMTDRRRGLHGYSQSFEFDRGKTLFAHGGQRGTAFLSMPGDGCALITNWPAVVELGRDTLAGRITRWDGAVDDFEGLHSVDLAVEMYLQGLFNGGGKRPSCNQQGNWIEPDGAGRTFYVGRRKSGKLLRVYEKGKQLGAPNSPWVRWEVECHNVDRTIPWDVLLEPGRYVAGSYPCMSWVQEEASRIRTVKAQDTITYDRMKRIGARAYGRLINVMLEREGSAERVVDILRREGIPARLQATDDVLRCRGDDDAV